MYELLKNRSVIEVRGKETKIFLNNLITNNLISINKSAIYTYMLTANGRFFADFFLIPQDEISFLLDVSQSERELLLDKLSLYKLHRQVEINDLTNQYEIYYSKHKPEFVSVYSYKDPRYHKLGWRTIIKNDNTLLQHLDLSYDLYLKDKYKFSIPDGSYDLIRNTSIVLEYGAEELNALNYNKGCYLGQELITRTKNTGVIRKKLFHLAGCNKLSASLSDKVLYNSDKHAIGNICSFWQNYGIGIINTEKLGINKTVFYQEEPLEITIPEWQF